MFKLTSNPIVLSHKWPFNMLPCHSTTSLFLINFHLVYINTTSKFVRYLCSHSCMCWDVNLKVFPSHSWLNMYGPLGLYIGMIHPCVKVKSLSLVRLFASPWIVAYQDSPSMRFSRQEYWSGVPLPSPPQFLNTFIFWFFIFGSYYFPI